jgi:hypothetical protein
MPLSFHHNAIADQLRPMRAGHAKSIEASTPSESASAAGSGSHQGEGHSGDQAKDRAAISAQGEDQ